VQKYSVNKKAEIYLETQWSLAKAEIYLETQWSLALIHRYKSERKPTR